MRNALPIRFSRHFSAFSLGPVPAGTVFLVRHGNLVMRFADITHFLLFTVGLVGKDAMRGDVISLSRIPCSPLGPRYREASPMFSLRVFSWGASLICSTTLVRSTCSALSSRTRGSYSCRWAHGQGYRASIQNRAHMTYVKAARGVSNPTTKHHTQISVS